MLATEIQFLRDCVSAFERGEQENAWFDMSLVLMSLRNRGEKVPVPVEKIYQNLLEVDILSMLKPIQ